MNIQITIRGISDKEAESSKSIRNYIEDNLSKLTDFLSTKKGPISIHTVVTVVNPKPNHEVEIRVMSPDKKFGANRKGPELYKVIDEVLDIAFEEATKRKERMVDERKEEGLAAKEERNLNE